MSKGRPSHWERGPQSKKLATSTRRLLTISFPPAGQSLHPHKYSNPARLQGHRRQTQGMKSGLSHEDRSMGGHQFLRAQVCPGGLSRCQTDPLSLHTPAPQWSSDQITSVTQSCPILCDPMNHSTPGLPVHHQLPEFTETHVHRVSDAIQPSHPLSSPSPPAPNPSQHQGLFQ